MRFTEEPMIQKAQEDIIKLQQKVMELNKVCQVTPSKEAHIEYLHTFYALVEKEHNMYVRLTLCEDKEAKEFKAYLDSEAREAGLPPDVTVPDYCNTMKKDIKRKLSEMGQDITDINEDFFL